jgi:hypothetical protein
MVVGKLQRWTYGRLTQFVRRVATRAAPLGYGDVLALSACGAPHPSLITADQLELLDDRFGAKTVAELFGYGRGFGLPSGTDCEEVRRLISV